MVREALAATKQSMILDYDYRPEHWVNLYSYMDPVGGRLDFYDVSSRDAVTLANPKRIQNRRDRRAWIPAWAHNQYWTNPMLRQILVDELTS